jgi:hypothetical protein
LPAVITFVPISFDIAIEDVRLGGAIVEIDPATGKALDIRRVMFRETDLEAS